jgi:hypothetical protein
MDTLETLQTFSLKLETAVNSLKWTDKSIMQKRVCIHSFTKKKVQTYAIERSDKITDTTHDLFVKSRMEDGTSSSYISRWISKTFRWQDQKANKLENSWVCKRHLKIR